MVNRKAYKAKSVSKTSVYFNFYLLPNPNMVLTGNHINSFFRYGNQMGQANGTRIFLQEEGITTVGDLVEFTEEKIRHQVINNC